LGDRPPLPPTRSPEGIQHPKDELGRLRIPPL